MPHTSSQTFLRELDKNAERRHSCRQPIEMATGMSPLPDTFTRDQHPDLRADFVMANPPSNLSSLLASVQFLLARNTTKKLLQTCS